MTALRNPHGDRRRTPSAVAWISSGWSDDRSSAAGRADHRAHAVGVAEAHPQTGHGVDQGRRDAERREAGGGDHRAAGWSAGGARSDTVTSSGRGSR